MINYAEVQYNKLKKQTDLIESEHPDWIRVYIQCRGIKGYWDELTWDQILIECPEFYGRNDIIKLRADEKFREYYKLRQDMERFEQLVRR